VLTHKKPFVRLANQRGYEFQFDLEKPAQQLS
jgi:hypothetical protein